MHENSKGNIKKYLKKGKSEYEEYVDIRSPVLTKVSMGDFILCDFLLNVKKN